MAQGLNCPVAIAVGVPPHPPSAHRTGPAVAVQSALVSSTTISLPPGPNAVGVHEAVAHFMVPDDPIQYAFPFAATAIAIGAFWLVASGVGVPAQPVVAHDITLPPLTPTPMFTQYTIPALTVMPTALLCPPA